MLRILESGNSLPYSFPVAPDAIFQPGTAMSLTVIGSQIFSTPSNGMSFIGVADDVKTNAFSAISWDEQIVVGPISPTILTTNGNGQLITTVDIKAELENPNVDENYFVSEPVRVALIPRNGVIVFPAGTLLNLDLAGSGTPDSIKTIVRYPYQIPNVVGDDSTAGSQRVTVWFQRMICEVDTFEVNQQYNLMGNLYISEHGLFTTRQVYPNSPIIAICTAPPSGINRSLQLMIL